MDLRELDNLGFVIFVPNSYAVLAPLSLSLSPSLVPSAVSSVSHGSRLGFSSLNCLTPPRDEISIPRVLARTERVRERLRIIETVDVIPERAVN